jgi:ATP-dependent Lon protease
MSKKKRIEEPGFCAHFKKGEYPSCLMHPVINRVTDMPTPIDIDDTVFGGDEDADLNRLHKNMETIRKSSEEKRLARTRLARGETTKPFNPDTELTGFENELRNDMLKKKADDRRMIQIFNVDKVLSELKSTELGGHEDKKRMLHDLRMAINDDGRRMIPDFKCANKKLVELASRFPNFVDAINGLTEDIALAAAGSPDRFQVAPILLDGVPGIGKTAFCNALADALGVPFVKVGAATLQNPYQIVGTARHWSNASPGVVFKELAESKSAVVVLLIDEVDKIHNNDSHPVIPALLELLEPESARKFVDQSYMVDLDASRFVVVMTSNQKDRIDTALLSRARIFQIEEPDEDQRRDIANCVHDALRRDTKRKIELNQDAVRTMAEGDGDLRAIARSVRSAFAKALIGGKKVSVPTVETKPAKQRIGF